LTVISGYIPLPGMMIRAERPQESSSQMHRQTQFFISDQVINETTRVLKKRGFAEQELRQIINSMFLICDVCAFTYDSAKLASELRETMSISYWDSHIAANAIMAGCDTLVSEDFQDGAFIKGVQVKNIFA